jgi:hypothetical protein
MFTVIVFAGDQSSAPSQKRVGCDDRGRFSKNATIELLGFGRQASALVVNQVALLLSYPACHRNQHQPNGGRSSFWPLRVRRGLANGKRMYRLSLEMRGMPNPGSYSYEHASVALAGRTQAARPVYPLRKAEAT